MFKILHYTLVQTKLKVSIFVLFISVSTRFLKAQFDENKFLDTQ